jgi:hypothetical protein
LWRSDDHGDTWTRDPDTAAKIPVWQVRFHPFVEDARLIGAGEDWWTGGMSASAASAVVAAAPRDEEIRVENVVGRRANWFQFFDKDTSTWTSVKLATPQRAAAFAPRDWRRVWISAGRRDLVRSDDACRTFRKIGSTGERHVWDIAVDPADNDRVLVGADDGIYCSSDGGLTFRRTRSSANVRQFVFTPETLLAATADGPLRSKDRGMSWEPLGLGFPELRCWSLARAPDGTVYAGPENAGVYRLDAGSDVWVQRSVGLLRVPTYRPALASGSSWAVVNQFGANTTLDGGNTWMRVGPGGHSIAAGDAGLVQLAVGGVNSGIRLTRDAGTTWQETSPIKHKVFWVHIHDGGVWARSDSGWLGRLEADLSWAADHPPMDAANRHWLADVLVLPRGGWVSIAIADGTLFRRRSATAPWRIVSESPAALEWGKGLWRLARTRIGWFAWRYDGGLAGADRFGGGWSEVSLPNGVSAIGGICSDPRGGPVAWIASLQGELFHVTRNDGGWNWKRSAEEWPTGRCAYLDCIQSPPSLLGSGPGGLYSIPIR